MMRPSRWWDPKCCTVLLNCDGALPCSLPPTVLFQNYTMFSRVALPIYVFSTESLHIVLRSLLACVCLGLREDVFGGCQPWIQLCLSEKYLAVTEAKPEPHEGEQGPRYLANRKLTPTFVHLPCIHSVEISVLLGFFYFQWGKSYVEHAQHSQPIHIPV